ncbi:unnamed protein product [marine sediment metagenome]|uniref:Uncharacterized protein n=1 Tax=marine sediment metagenome TaxID=412755 RepID=X0RIH7_9ZZZZ
MVDEGENVLEGILPLKVVNQGLTLDLELFEFPEKRSPLQGRFELRIR